MSLVSPVQIVNMALSHIGAKDTIESLDEASVEARTGKVWYNHARLSCLEAHGWTFARKRLELALDEEDAPLDWDYRYQYPSDCIVARRIVNFGLSSYNNWRVPYDNETDAIAFEVELASTGDRHTILTNQAEAVLLYTRDISDTYMFSNHFIHAMSYALAGYMAFKLTGKLAVKQLMEQNFVRTITQAAAINANEGIAKAPRDAEWLRARQ